MNDPIREALEAILGSADRGNSAIPQRLTDAAHAALAAAPPEPEPVGEGPDQVREALRKLCDAILNQFFGNDTELPKELIQATNEAQMILAQQQHYPVRLTIKPSPELIEELNMQPGVVKRLPIDKPFALGEGEGLTDEELKAAYWEAFHDSPRAARRRAGLPARAAIAADRQRRVQPVPVTERLPGPGDCTPMSHGPTVAMVGRALSLAFAEGIATWRIKVRTNSPHLQWVYPLTSDRQSVLEQFERMDEGQLIGVIVERPPNGFSPDVPAVVTRLELGLSHATHHPNPPDDPRSRRGRPCGAC